MQGNPLNEVEIEDIESDLTTVGSIAGELMPSACFVMVPESHYNYITHIALAPEFQLFNALYYMSRQVVFSYNKLHMFVALTCLYAHDLYGNYNVELFIFFYYYLYSYFYCLFQVLFESI